MEDGMKRYDVMAEDGQGLSVEQVADGIFDDLRSILPKIVALRDEVAASDYGADFIQHLIESDNLLDTRVSVHDKANEWATTCAEESR